MRFVRVTFLSALFLVIPVSIWAQPLSATITGDATVCQNATPPSVTFTGYNGTAPYTFTYKINGGVDLFAVSDGSGEAIVIVPTDVAGGFVYTLVSVDDNFSEPVTASYSVTITITALPVATFSYTGNPYCSNGTDPLPTFSGGGTAGIFSSTLGLVFISTTTGQVDLPASAPGTYTVTNTIAASGGCGEVTATSPITITTLPTAAISYTGSPWCTTAVTQSVALTGTGEYTGGTYSESPAGLNINSSTGLITPGTSTAGTYTVTYTIAATSGCDEVTATTDVTINSVPVIGSVNHTDVTVCGGSDGTITIVATGYAPLSYSINGGIDFLSNGGVFTGLGNGTYNVAVRNGYGCVTTGVEETVNDGVAPPPPAAGDDATYCFGDALDDLAATASAGGTLTWYSDPGLTNVLGNGTTLTPLNNIGVTNYYVTETSGGCESTATQVTITITAVPTATIIYEASPFCTSVTALQAVTILGTGAYTGGTYSASPAGLSINSETGAITPSASSPNTYTVTYTIPASGGCPSVQVNTSATITVLPTAAISYTGSPWCTTAVTQSVALTGTGEYTGGTYSASPAGLNINSSTGLITPGTSTAGTYTVTYTITAVGGCGTVVAITSVSVTALPGAAGSISGPASFTPETSGIGYSVSPITAATSYIWSYSGTGVTINGSGANVTLDFSASAAPGTLSVFGRNGCGDGPASTLALSPSTKTLTLSSVLLEGLYNGGGTMREASNGFAPQYPGIADRITVELHNAASYSSVSYSVSNVDLSLIGTVTITVPAAFSGTYYITIKHRNSIETTTASPVSFAGTTISQSFDDRSDVFGDNLKSSGDGHYLIYGADVNQDGIVDTGDMNDVDNGSAAILIGYNSPDANGDGLVDTSDMNMVDNNSTAIVTVRTPF